MNLQKISTVELINELRNREGVESIVIDPHQIEKLKVEGPMILLKILD